MAVPPLKKWRILGRRELSHDVIELRLERPPQDDLSFRPGQYMSVVIPGAGPEGRDLRRAYSIASPPESDEIELCIKLVQDGPGTMYLNRLRPGDELRAQMPFGNFVISHDPALPAIFIATGTGIAPHRSMVLSADWKQTGPVAFVVGVRKEADIIYPGLFDLEQVGSLAKDRHVALCLTQPEPHWKGFRGRVTDYLRDLKWDFARSHYYVCGNGDMIAGVKLFLTQKGVAKSQIHAEKYY